MIWCIKTYIIAIALELCWIRYSQVQGQKHPGRWGIVEHQMPISDIRPGFKLKPQKNQHFPVTILTAIINVLAVACRILPGSNAPFCPRLLDSDVVQHSSSRELPQATASLGLNTCDTEAVQLDPAMNLDQSQSSFVFPPSILISTQHPSFCWQISTQQQDTFHPTSQRKTWPSYPTF